MFAAFLKKKMIDDFGCLYELEKEKDLEVRFLEENKRQQYVELKQNIENKYIPNFRNMES